MSKRALDIDKAIATTRAIPGLAVVADLAELGRRVCAVIRDAGGLPRVRKAKADGKPRPARRTTQPLQPTNTEA